MVAIMRCIIILALFLGGCATNETKFKKVDTCIRYCMGKLGWCDNLEINNYTPCYSNTFYVDDRKKDESRCLVVCK